MEEYFSNWENEIVAQEYDGDPRIFFSNIKLMRLLE